MSFHRRVRRDRGEFFVNFPLLFSASSALSAVNDQ